MNRKCISHLEAGAFWFVILVNIYTCCGALINNLERDTFDFSSSDVLKDKKENILDSNHLIYHADATCNALNKCKNGGICNKVCQCPKGTSGDFCEGVDWCEDDRCGLTDGVECLYNETSTQGYCKCKKSYHIYDDNTKRCQECNCGNNGNCVIMGNAKTCICAEGYVEYESKCKPCECGSGSINCFFKNGGIKACNCKDKYAQRTYWGTDARCQICDCGEHGKCHYDGDKRICECEEHYREFRGECRECYCGNKGSCKFSSTGEKICRCDYGYSPYKGICFPCNCDPWDIRGIGAECIFVDENRRCMCPNGFLEYSTNCEDINECLNESACPPNTDCVNVPGTFECECKAGYQITRRHKDVKDVGCQDIDECSINGTCIDPMTECINTPGSYNCACKTGYYPTAGTKGDSYIPMYNMCYPATDQWLAATIALGTIMFFGITTTCCYMLNKDNESRASSNLEGLRSVAGLLELLRICV